TSFATTPFDIDDARDRLKPLPLLGALSRSSVMSLDRRDDSKRCAATRHRHVDRGRGLHRLEGCHNMLRRIERLSEDGFDAVAVVESKFESQRVRADSKEANADRRSIPLLGDVPEARDQLGSMGANELRTARRDGALRWRNHGDRVDDLRFNGFDVDARIARAVFERYRRGEGLCRRRARTGEEAQE